MTTPREDGRQPDQMRRVRIAAKHIAQVEGSALIELGETTVFCAVSVENRLPAFLPPLPVGLTP